MGDSKAPGRSLSESIDIIDYVTGIGNDPRAISETTPICLLNDKKDEYLQAGKYTQV